MAAPDVREEDAELRCKAGVLAGIIRTHQGIRCVEVKCTHWRCTQGEAVSVFHYYSCETGALVDTVIYRDIGKRFKR